MAEVFSARSSSWGIVLVSVFVPVAFFPGTTGRLYQQFSLTIAFEVVLSVFNAVTFTPALAALLLERRAPHRLVLLLGHPVIDGGTNFFLRGLRVFVRWRWAMVGVFLLARWASPTGSRRWSPRAFVPEEDQGYVIIAISQAPEGASLFFRYTTNIGRQIEAVFLLLAPSRRSPARSSLVGFSFGGTSPEPRASCSST